MAKKKKAFVVVSLPQSEELYDLIGFREHARLISGREGLEKYGVCSYVVDSDWLDSHPNKESGDIIITTEDVREIHDSAMKDVGLL